MINRSQLKFHETFQPEIRYISQIIELASRNYSGSKFDISECTGIPTGKQKGKVEPHIKYASYMGLISYTMNKGIYELSLTDLGTAVFTEDKYLQEELTKWICHYKMTQREEGAPQWAYLINKAHKGFVESLTFDSLVKSANEFFDVTISFEELFGVTKRSYKDGIFEELEFLSVEDNVSKIHFEEFSEKDELVFVYAYALLHNWSLCFPDKTEITMVELSEDLAFGKTFGFSHDTINNVLDLLSDEGLVTVNRQLYPATIIRTSEEEEIIPLLYSRLL